MIRVYKDPNTDDVIIVRYDDDETDEPADLMHLPAQFMDAVEVGEVPANWIELVPAVKP